MNTLFILNDAPYGSEKVYNALRLSMALQKEQAPQQVRIFLMADSVAAALPDQSTPQGYYNIERMLSSVIRRGAEVKSCGTCAAARGLNNLALIEGIELSTMSQLAQWTAQADKVLVF